MIAFILAALVSAHAEAAYDQGPVAPDVKLVRDNVEMHFHVDGEGAIVARTLKTGSEYSDENKISNNLYFKSVFNVLDRAFAVDGDDRLVEIKVENIGYEHNPSGLRTTAALISVGGLVGSVGSFCYGMAAGDLSIITTSVGGIAVSFVCLLNVDVIGRRTALTQKLEFFGGPAPFFVRETKTNPGSSFTSDVMIAREGGTPESLFQMLFDGRDCARNLNETKVLIR